MQKKSLVVFSLFIITALFISACQDTVGGPNRTGSGNNLGGTFTSVTGRGESINIGISATSSGQCNILSGYINKGEFVGVQDHGDKVYVVVGCIQATALEGSFDKRDVVNGGLVDASSTRALLIELDQEIINPEKTLSANEVFVMGGVVAPTGF